jgi:hypothetical protein
LKISFVSNNSEASGFTLVVCRVITQTAAAKASAQQQRPLLQLSTESLLKEDTTMLRQPRVPGRHFSSPTPEPSKSRKHLTERKERRRSSVATSTPFRSEKKSWLYKVLQDDLAEEIEKWKHALAAEARVSPPRQEIPMKERDKGKRASDDPSSPDNDFFWLPDGTRPSYEKLESHICLELGMVSLTVAAVLLATCRGTPGCVTTFQDLLLFLGLVRTGCLSYVLLVSGFIHFAHYFSTL